MTRTAAHHGNVVRLTLTSPADRRHLHTLLSEVRPGTPIHLTIGGDPANDRAAAAPASYAEAMRVVEDTYYNAI